MFSTKTPLQAWEDFAAAASIEEDNDVVTLSLIRDARVFTTAPLEETREWEILIGAVSKRGDRAGVIAFGEILRDWSKKNGYHLAGSLSGGIGTLLAAM